MADEDESGARPGPGQVSRRALLRRAGQGAVAAGLAAWVVPEIVVASPAGAQPLSSPPAGGGGPGTGGPGSPGGPTAGFGPGTGGGGTGGGGGFPPGPGTGGEAPGTAPSGASTPSTGRSTVAGPGGVTGTGHGSLAFTGFDPEALLGLGATLVAGGWTINRWASRHEQYPEAPPPGA